MKIRLDFVTNSSSSSFIMGYKPPGGKLSEDLLDFVGRGFGIRFITKIAEVDNWCQKMFGWLDDTETVLAKDNYVLQRIIEIKKAIGDGYAVFCLEIPDGSECTPPCAYCTLDGFKIIKELG